MKATVENLSTYIERPLLYGKMLKKDWKRNIALNNNSFKFAKNNSYLIKKKNLTMFDLN